MSLVVDYLAEVQAGRLRPDAAQKRAVMYLQSVSNDLQARANQRKHRFFPFHKVQPVRGLYFWGGVGRGKTLLMDLFYQAVPVREKYRIHFHAFMSQIHAELKTLQGHKDPLKMVAQHLARQYKLLCFDEFVVNDVADAMILANLFLHLFAAGITLVTTSNVPPQKLYEHGLQRDYFLPTITLIEQYTQVLNVDSGVDYRQQEHLVHERYFTPLLGEAEFMQSSFTLFTNETPHACELKILGRVIAAYGMHKGVLWTDFKSLCASYRSQEDYLVLARDFHTVLLSVVPQMSAAMDDYARRFINLIDILYDNKIQLVLSATVPIDRLYTGSRLSFEFERTKSRLWEMQADSWQKQTIRQPG